MSTTLLHIHQISTKQALPQLRLTTTEGNLTLSKKSSLEENWSNKINNDEKKANRDSFMKK